MKYDSHHYFLRENYILFFLILEQMKCVNTCIIDVGVVVNDYYAPFIREIDELASLKKKKENILAIWQLSGLVFSVPLGVLLVIKTLKDEWYIVIKPISDTWADSVSIHQFLLKPRSKAAH